MKLHSFTNVLPGGTKMNSGLVPDPAIVLKNPDNNFSVSLELMITQNHLRAPEAKFSPTDLPAFRPVAGPLPTR